MSNISEGYMVGFDISERDESVMMVFERKENTLSVIKVIKGEEARVLYEKLTNKKLEEERKN